MCLSCTVADIFSVEYWRGFEILVIGHSRSLKMVPFERLCTVFFSHSVATQAVFLAVTAQHTNVTDRHCKRHKPCLCISSRGKNECHGRI